METCFAGIKITKLPCPKCGASDSDLCGEEEGETYPAGLEITRLMAVNAALLDALEGIVDFCDDPSGSDKPETLAGGLARLLPEARAAIASAKP